jgi:hypothetical protein
MSYRTGVVAAALCICFGAGRAIASVRMCMRHEQEAAETKAAADLVVGE